jgi:hypothetical protein
MPSPTKARKTSGPLDLQRSDVGLQHVDVEPAPRGDGLRPQREIDVAVRDPHGVVGHPQHDALRHDLPREIAHHRVAAYVHFQIAEVPRAQEVAEAKRVDAAQLGLALRAHVPERHALDQRRVVLLVGPTVPDRHVHVVVHHVLDRTRALGLLEVRRPTHVGMQGMTMDGRPGARHGCACSQHVPAPERPLLDTRERDQ